MPSVFAICAVFRRRVAHSRRTQPIISAVIANLDRANHRQFPPKTISALASRLLVRCGNRGNENGKAKLLRIINGLATKAACRGV
jgi:hypothetical protein